MCEIGDFLDGEQKLKALCIFYVERIGSCSPMLIINVNCLLNKSETSVSIGERLPLVFGFNYVLLSVSCIIEFKGLIMLFYNLRAKIYKKTDTAKFLRKK